MYTLRLGIRITEIKKYKLYISLFLTRIHIDVEMRIYDFLSIWNNMKRMIFE